MRIVRNKETGTVRIRKLRGENDRAAERLGRALAAPGSKCHYNNRNNRRHFWKSQRCRIRSENHSFRCELYESIEKLPKEVDITKIKQPFRDWMPMRATSCGAVTVTSGRVQFYRRCVV